MAAILFSQHSSNPLEASTSDAHNVHYNRAYREATAQLHPEDVSPSSDPLARNIPLQEYHQHIAQIVPGHPQADHLTREPHWVDLDEDMSDDELDVVPHDDQVLHTNDPDADAHGETYIEYDEEMENDWEEEEGPKEKDWFELDELEELESLEKKSEEEIVEIEKEMKDFEETLPQLQGEYRLLDRLGTGTFSSVYKALDLRYHEYDNSPWLGHHPPESSAHFQSVARPPGSAVFVAIKRIYVTSGPERIRNELMIMEMGRGARHVSQIITAFRHEDQVAIVMPYHRNEDFREYFETLPMEGIKSYFQCLLRALRDIHTRGIIHRDVKPANFLFDPSTGQGSLCDFGLAQVFEKAPTLGTCLHTQPTANHPHGQIQKKHQYNEKLVKDGQQDARKKSKMPAHVVGVPDKDTRMPMKANRAGTRGFRAPEVLFKCGQQSGAVDVWSVGIILLFFLTRKFPLFQSNDDIEALMELASIFGRKKMEGVATLHARKFATNVPDIPQEQVSWSDFAEKLNPDLLTPPPPNERLYPYTLPSYRAKLRRQEEKERERQLRRQSARHKTPTKSTFASLDNDDELPLPPTSHATSSPLHFPGSSPSKHRGSENENEDDQEMEEARTTDRPSSPLSQTDIELSWERDIRHAMDLVGKLLEPESVKRITPAAALAHPFLREDDNPDDDSDPYVPHEFGQGVCGEYHFVDEVTDQPGVIVRERKCVCECGECEDEYEDVRKIVAAGEGIAIGDEPCEFHRNYIFL